MEQKMHMPESKTNIIKPMGIKTVPDWVRYEFEGIEEFHKYYSSLIIQTPEENGC